MILGENTIADFQSSRARGKMSNKIAGYTHIGAAYYRKIEKGGYPQSFYHHKGRQYRFSISVQEVSNRRGHPITGKPMNSSYIRK